jgi:hypothetical protein
MILDDSRVNNDPSGSLFTFFDFRMYLVYQTNRMADNDKYSIHEKVVTVITAAMLIGMIAKTLFF